MPPRAPLARSVTAKTIAKSASLPLVMKTFSPFKIHESPSLTAVMWMLPASDPAPGSVSAKHDRRSPLIVGSK